MRIIISETKKIGNITLRFWNGNNFEPDISSIFLQQELFFNTYDHENKAYVMTKKEFDRKFNFWKTMIELSAEGDYEGIFHLTQDQIHIGCEWFFQVEWMG